jgi:hypothetical protein
MRTCDTKAVSSIIESVLCSSEPYIQMPWFRGRYEIYSQRSCVDGIRIRVSEDLYGLNVAFDVSGSSVSWGAACEILGSGALQSATHSLDRHHLGRHRCPVARRAQILAQS